MFKIPLFGLSSVFYTSCTKKEPYLFIGKTHKFKNSLNLMTLVIRASTFFMFFLIYMLKWVRKFAGTGSLYTDKSRMKKA